MEDKIKTIEIDGVEFPFNANKAFEKDGHVYCRQCGEQIDSEPLACLGSKKIIFGRRCKKVDKQFIIYVAYTIVVRVVQGIVLRKKIFYLL